MRYWVLIVALVCAGCGGGEQKIAIVDVDAVIKGYRKSQEVYAGLEKEKRDLETRGQRMLEELNSLVKEAGLLSEETRKERESRIREKTAAVEEFRRDASKNLMDRTNAEYLKIVSETRAAAAAVAARRGVHIMLDSSTVLFGEKRLDLTAEVCEELNRRSQGGGDEKKK